MISACSFGVCGLFELCSALGRGVDSVPQNDEPRLKNYTAVRAEKAAAAVVARPRDPMHLKVEHASRRSRTRHWIVCVSPRFNPIPQILESNFYEQSEVCGVQRLNEVA